MFHWFLPSGPVRLHHLLYLITVSVLVFGGVMIWYTTLALQGAIGYARLQLQQHGHVNGRLESRQDTSYVDHPPKDTGNVETRPTTSTEDSLQIAGNVVPPKNKGPEDSPQIEGTVEIPQITSTEEEVFDGFYRTNETLKGEPVIKVLLLAYQRSGSTFTGELLTSAQKSLYVFEPLYHFKALPMDDPGNSTILREKVKVLGDLLDCRDKVFSAYNNKFMIRGVSLEECSSVRLRLLKVIRARKSFLVPWLAARSDIKVVHLVRDPRAVMRSVEATKAVWSAASRSSHLLCSRMRENLMLEDMLGTHRYMLVKYEDLMGDVQGVTAAILKFMGVSYNADVGRYISSHVGSDSKSNIRSWRNGSASVFNTHRVAKFEPDQWKLSMDPEAIRQVEQTDACREVMRNLRYNITSTNKDTPG